MVLFWLRLCVCSDFLFCLFLSFLQLQVRGPANHGTPPAFSRRTPWPFREDKNRLTGVPRSPWVKKHEIRSDPISADPICPFPSICEARPRNLQAGVIIIMIIVMIIIIIIIIIIISSSSSNCILIIIIITSIISSIIVARGTFRPGSSVQPSSGFAMQCMWHFLGSKQTNLIRQITIKLIVTILSILIITILILILILMLMLILIRILILSLSLSLSLLLGHLWSIPASSWVMVLITWFRPDFPQCAFW